MTTNENILNISYETTGGNIRNTKVCPETLSAITPPQAKYQRYNVSGPNGRMFEISRAFCRYYDKWIISSYRRGNWRLVGELDGCPAFITEAIKETP